MSDEIDRAAENIEQLERAALTHRKPVLPAPTGRCFWCDEIVADDRRFCPDDDCAERYEREARIMKNKR